MGLTVKQARLIAGLSQTELARRAATSRTALAAIEAGRRVPSEALRRRLIEATGVRPSHVLAARRSEVELVLARHRVSGLRLAGSAARGEDRQESDLDLVVSLPDGMGGLELAEMGDELEALLGVDVDIISDRSTGPVADAIIASAVPA
ncbi:MAG: nucleotidyltransferase domain-containing protein [Acidimicrobiales bacterium]